MTLMRNGKQRKRNMVHRNKRRMTALACFLALALTMLTGCGTKGKEEITSLDQLGEPGTKIGVPGDMLEFETLQQDYPEAKVLVYDNYPLAYDDVAKGRLDAYVYARREMEFAIENGTAGVRLLDENYSKNTVAVGLSPISPIPDLQEKINTFISELNADGTLDDMYMRWVILADDTMPKITLPEHRTVQLRVGTTGTVMPYSYYVGTELRGYDIELAYRFAAWLGADVEFKIYDFGGIVTAAETGDVDCIMSNLYYTPEKGEAIPFSDPLFDVEVTAMVRASDLTTTGSVVAKGGYGSVDELAGKRIGVVTGTIHDSLAAKRLPTAQIVYFNTIADMLDALKAGKIDAMVRPQSGALFISYEDKSITWLDEHLTDADVSFAFPKTEDGAALRERFSVYIRELRESGELETLREKWFGEDESVKTMLDISALPATNGMLRLAATGTQMPFNYVRDNVIVGFEIELAARFCEENGFALQVEQMNFDGVLASVQAGKCDFACACLAATEERKESVDFSEPHFAESVVFVVLDSTAGKQESFLDGVRASFEKTFIRENRWQLFVEGIGTTMLITVLSILFGTALGFGVFMLCRNGNPVANALTRFCVWLVQGMPVVVLLMILYYVIFGKIAISGTAVSVIGFTLVFGAAVYGMLKAGVGAIDRGQTEAAYALGYSDHKAFFRVVLPQAIPHFLPSYKGQITALIKATAVVGYVAVQDLTKMGDIVRSRTYEAFFPLIAVAVIYFVLAAILTFLVNKVEVRIDPRKRSRKELLKGVRTDD